MEHGGLKILPALSRLIKRNLQYRNVVFGISEDDVGDFVGSSGVVINQDRIGIIFIHYMVIRDDSIVLHKKTRPACRSNRDASEPRVALNLSDPLYSLVIKGLGIELLEHTVKNSRRVLIGLLLNKVDTVGLYQTVLILFIVVLESDAILLLEVREELVDRLDADRKIDTVAAGYGQAHNAHDLALLIQGRSSADTLT